MRLRPLAALLPLLAPVVLLAAACGDQAGDAPRDTTASTDAVTTEPTSEESTGSPDKPAVDIPDELPTELVVTDLTVGSGRKAAEGDTVVVDYVGVRSEDGTEFDNSYDRGEPYPVRLGAGQVIKGWDQGLVGAQAGGRRQLDIPADLAYGDRGSGDVIKPGDALTFVVDIRAVLPANDPADEPTESPAAAADATDLVVEDVDVPADGGAEAAYGDTAYINYVIFDASGKKLASSWANGAPEGIPLEEQPPTLAGLIEGIVGMKVGGRRNLVIPADQAFGPEGNPGLGLPAGEPMVVIVDLVALG